MKKYLSYFLMLLFFTSADAQAQGLCVENFYGKILSGANFLENTSKDCNSASYQTGYVIAGSLGHSWQCGLQLEAEYAFRRNAINKIHFHTEGSSKRGHFQTCSYMVNLLWKLSPSSWGYCWNTQPYVGVGSGYDFQRMYSSNCRIIYNQKWNHCAWQAMAGLTYPIFCDTELALEYKFHQGGCHFYNHTIGVGLIYNFRGFN